ncbi:glycosyltransferase family 4 protein [Winogradskyella ouciana]|uniref:Glycosyltransferase n=1 Tax=Winogradskyella ouciana TaxID=2608631 RepID=A0A7K1GB69_9FLAO|nr:glycosyltransferase family 4 protein [Winogradskyella ouciana]MTE26537.1 glycosyltransferase [Winogradskyella ouciana]
MKLAILGQAYLHDPTANVNGTLVQLHNLAHAFSNHGIEVHYVSLTKDKEKPTYELNNGIHFYWIQYSRGLLAWKNVMASYKKKLLVIAPDVVYVRGRNVMQYLAGNYARELDAKYVWNTNGDDSAEFWKNVKRLKASNKTWIKKIILLPLKVYEDYYINEGMKMVDLVINQSEWQKKETKKRLNKTGVVLPSYFLPVVNTLPKENVLLWMANLSRAKQPKRFIDIVAKLDMHNWKAILAGGTTDDKFEKEVKEYDLSHVVEFVGKVPFKESFVYYQKAKIFVNTSLPDADGLPNAYIQSWLSGTVTVSLHHDPNNWMDKHNIGYCAHGDFTKLVEKLKYLMQHPKELSVMGNNAIEFAEQKFSSHTIIDDYVNLLKS